MNCPLCKWQLSKKKDTGEGVKWCKNCGRFWFILQTSEPTVSIKWQTSNNNEEL